MSMTLIRDLMWIKHYYTERMIYVKRSLVFKRSIDDSRHAEIK